MHETFRVTRFQCTVGYFNVSIIHRTLTWTTGSCSWFVVVVDVVVVVVVVVCMCMHNGDLGV